MKAVTLRNLTPELQKTIRQRAKEKQTSVNKAVLGLLEEAVGGVTSTKQRRHYDLDALAGAWGKEEAKAFEKSLAHQRAIDPSLWR